MAETQVISTSMTIGQLSSIHNGNDWGLCVSVCVWGGGGGGGGGGCRHCRYMCFVSDAIGCTYIGVVASLI